MRGNIGAQKGEPTLQMKNGQREVVRTRIVGTRGKTRRMANNKGIKQGVPETKDDDGAAIATSTLNGKHPVTPANEKLEVVPLVIAASPALPSYHVGRGIFLPFGQLLPRCAMCNFSALIAVTNLCVPGGNYVLCLNHGLLANSATRDLVLLQAASDKWSQYGFISSEHETAIREFLA